jgi:hypothetical protein
MNQQFSLHLNDWELWDGRQNCTFHLCNRVLSYKIRDCRGIVSSNTIDSGLPHIDRALSQTRNDEIMDVSEQKPNWHILRLCWEMDSEMGTVGTNAIKLWITSIRINDFIFELVVKYWKHSQSSYCEGLSCSAGKSAKWQSVFLKWQDYDLLSLHQNQLIILWQNIRNLVHWSDSFNLTAIFRH